MKPRLLAATLFLLLLAQVPLSASPVIPARLRSLSVTLIGGDALRIDVVATAPVRAEVRERADSVIMIAIADLALDNPLEYPVNRSGVLWVKVAPVRAREVELRIRTGRPMEVMVDPEGESDRVAIDLWPKPSGQALPAGPPPAPKQVAGRSIDRNALELRPGSGKLIEVSHLVRVATSNPEAAGVVPVTDREVLLLGKKPGHATVWIWEGKDRLRVFEVRVADQLEERDPAIEVSQMVKRFFPTSEVEVAKLEGGSGLPGAEAGQPSSDPVNQTPQAGQVPAPGRRWVLVLSGFVDTQMDQDRIEALVRATGIPFVSYLGVRRPLQVQLFVQAVEVERTAARDVGLTWGTATQTSDLAGGLFTFQVLTDPLKASGVGMLLSQLSSLVKEGKARLLAQPRLLVLAGREATLLLGGEVPIPISEQGTVTIQFKEFGVKLRARPELAASNRILLALSPEVSTLDFANGVKVSGFTIPALRTRRVSTVVAMEPGQTLVIGGLLQNDETQLIQRIPILGDLPVIGALFRSTSFQQRKTELVILVSPQILEGR